MQNKRTFGALEKIVALDERCTLPMPLNIIHMNDHHLPEFIFPSNFIFDCRTHLRRLDFAVGRRFLAFFNSNGNRYLVGRYGDDNFCGREPARISNQFR